MPVIREILHSKYNRFGKNPTSHHDLKNIERITQSILFPVPHLLLGVGLMLYSIASYISYSVEDTRANGAF